MASSDIEKYLDMSLDEYIATKKAVQRQNNNNNGNKSAITSNNVASAFKAERRNSKITDDIDEDEIMDNESELLAEETDVDTNDKINKSFGIWRGPSADTNYIDLDYMRDEFDEMFNDPELQQKPSDAKRFAKQPQQQQAPQRDLRERLNNTHLNTVNTNNSNKEQPVHSANTNNTNRQNLNANKPTNMNLNKQNNMNLNKQNNMNLNKPPNMNTNQQNNNMNANAKKWSNMQQTQQQSISLTSLNTDVGLSANGQYRRRWNNNNNYNNNYNRNFRRRNNDGCGNGRGMGGGFMHNSNQSLNWNNRNGGMNCTNMLPINNNGRIQRFNQQRYNQDVVNKNIKAVLEQINSNNSIYANRQTGSVRDLTIECPNVLVPGRLTGAAGALQQTAATHQKLQPPQSSTTQTQSDLKALLGVNESNLKAETMAMWAGKLLDLFQSAQQETVHKPIYDMQVQKEIHELQGKSLLYKCPSGEVVSSDGTGIDNCKITPSSSGVTLNYRFG